MKKIVINLCVAAALSCTSVFAASADFPISAKPWENLRHNLRVLRVFELNEEYLGKIMQGHCPDVAVEFPAGTTLPVRFFLNGDLANFMGEGGPVEIKQTFYARYVENNLILSSNLTDWRPFFEFITGTATVALCVQEGHPPSLSVGAEANRPS